ncbi:hypothetical protein POTOM_038410 [Populus tomentosa]|uniref:3-hydroxyisobutyryl-CoA hydrolase n=1 Tax=Populus tomentosa TaxID=118781 RepID=A0A8X8CDF4_POPTO|nr:hypothetical protein POTOM_038410 [Populus tomentosa]
MGVLIMSSPCGIRHFEHVFLHIAECIQFPTPKTEEIEHIIACLESEVPVRIHTVLACGYMKRECLGLTGARLDGAEMLALEVIDKCFSKETVEEVLLSLIREGRTQNLEQCLVREYTICCNFIPATASNDALEWEPSRLEPVSKDMVDRCFTGIDDDDDDWQFLQLPDRSSMAEALKPKL